MYVVCCILYIALHGLKAKRNKLYAERHCLNLREAHSTLRSLF